MLAPTLITLPPEILSHIFSYLIFKDITTVSPNKSLLPYYQEMIYKSIFIVKESAYASFNATLLAKPNLAKLIIKFDIDFRDDDFRYKVNPIILVDSINMMKRLQWLGLGEPSSSVISFLSTGRQALRTSLPRLRHLNICTEHYATTLKSLITGLLVVSKLTQIESLSIEIDNENGTKLEAEDESTLSLYNFDHIRYLDIKGELNQSLFTRLLAQFKQIRCLTLRTLDSLDLTPIHQYSYLEALHLLDATISGSEFEDYEQVTLFTGLKELSIGDATLFPRESLPLLSKLSSLQTLNLGLEVWNDNSAISNVILLLLSDQHKMIALKNLNFNTRLDYYESIPAGTRWKDKSLDESELRDWEWGGILRDAVAILDEEDLVELFEVAEKNKIRVGGQIVEVEWPEFGRPHLYADV